MLSVRITQRAALGPLRGTDVCLFTGPSGAWVVIASGGHVVFVDRGSLDEGFATVARSIDSWVHLRAKRECAEPNRLDRSGHVLAVCYRAGVFHVIEDATSPGDPILPPSLRAYCAELLEVIRNGETVD